LGLGLAEKLAYGVVGKGDGGGGVGGAGELAQCVVAEAGLAAGVALGALGQQAAKLVALKMGNLAGACVCAAQLYQVGELACGVVAVALVALYIA
jgi:hypothetical protein